MHKKKTDNNIVELFTIQRAFYSGDYEQVVSIDPETFTETNVVHAQVLVARAQIALGRHQELLASLSGVTADEVELSVVKQFALYTLGGSGRAAALGELEQAIKAHKTNQTVQYIGGLVLVAEQRLDEALELLSLHEGSLEAISLIVQIRLVQNRLDLAQKEVAAAKKWAQDNIVFNLAEAWLDLRLGGSDKYQDGYYIYEELASNGTATFKSLQGQIVSQLQLGRLPEASESIQEALALAPNNPELLINAIASAILQGNKTAQAELEAQLKQVAPAEHAYLADLKEKEDAFDKVAAKYAETAGL